MSDDKQSPVAEPAVVQQLRSLVEKARAGDETVLPDLRAAMDDHPELWEHFGTLSRHVQGKWIELLGGSDLCIAEALTRKANAMRGELEGEAASPLEKLLIDALITASLEAEYFSLVLAAAGENGSLRQNESLQRRRDASHRRYLMATKTLAEVRKLLPTSSSGNPRVAKKGPMAGAKANSPGKPSARSGSADPPTIPMKPRKKR